MTETQATINEWQHASFPGASVDGVLNHLHEEVKEFFDFAEAGPEGRTAAAVEAADIVILLYCWAKMSGFDLHGEIDRKMAINRARQWNIQPDGTGRHK